MNYSHPFSTEDLKQSLKLLRRDFYLLVGTIFIFIALGETGLLTNGMLATSPTLDYTFSVAGVILALGSVYLGLKLFAKYTKDKPFVTSHHGNPLRCYRNLSIIRLSLIVTAASFNLIAYYLTMNTNCLLMSFVPLVALVFCWPTRDKLENFTSFVCHDDDGTEEDDNRDEESRNEYNT